MLAVNNLFIDSQHGRLPQQRRLLNVMNSKQQSSFNAAGLLEKLSDKFIDVKNVETNNKKR